DGGDHQLDDEEGAPQPGPAERLPAQAHRRRRRPDPGRRQQADEAVPADGKDDGQDGPRRHEGPDARHARHDGRRRKAVLVEPTHGRLGLQWSAGPSRGSGPWVGSTHQAGIPFIIAGLPCHSGSWATPKPPWSRSVSPAAAPRSAPSTTSSSPTAVAPATAATSSGWVTTTRSRPAARSASRWTWPA